MKSGCIPQYLSDVKAGSTVAVDEPSPLHFRDMTLADMPRIRRILEMSPSLTCDYSIGGIYMWINYFKYKFCIVDDTLFITGAEENRLDCKAFSCPVGAMPLPEAIAMLERYCNENDLTLRFSAVPADRLSCFLAYNPDFKVEELTDWSDYVYEADKFATLSGKKLAKKRNHVNRFNADYPSAHLSPLTAVDVPALKQMLARWTADEPAETVSSTRLEELDEVFSVLDNLDAYAFDGAILRSGGADDRIVAFTLAEKINDTLFVHIEKMDHTVAGAGETIAHLFATSMLEKYPDLRFLNREEDCGDEGLRRAKQSWQPAMLLRKYNIERP